MNFPTPLISKAAVLSGFLMGSFFHLSAKETGLRFPMESVSLPLGESQILTFLSQEVATEDALPTVNIQPADGAEILLPARLLTGEKQGYLRIRPLRPGSTVLQVGDAYLKVEAVENPRKVGQSHLPSIVTPSSGATVWGKIYAAVEIFSPDSETRQAHLELKGSDGQAHQPDSALSSQSGPWRREVFPLDTDSWPKGPVMLTPTLRSKNGNPLHGRPLILLRADPDPDNQIAGECEDYLEGSGLERFGLKPLKTSEQADASGGKSVEALSSNPAWSLKTEIREAGSYQLFMTVRGDEAGGALPSVGVYVDEKERTSSNARLAIKDWHRVPVGPPIPLEAGPRILTVQFRNDFYAPKRDRNMWLDRFELARVGGGAGNNQESSPSMMMETMMAAEPMMAMSMAAGAGTTPLEPVRLAFRERLEGKQIHGPVSIEALCRWASYDPASAPPVELRINGQTVAKQYGSDLRFEIGLDQFQPGANEIQLVARTGAVTFQSITQKMHLKTPPDWKAPSSGKQTVYGVLDPAWDPGMSQRLEGKMGQVRREAAFFANGESFINLPETMQGHFKIEIEGRGQAFEGLPEMEVALRKDQDETIVGKAQLDGGSKARSVGTVELGTGSKQLAVRFVNDHYSNKEPHKGDRNAWLRLVRLIEIPTQNTTENLPPPVVSYPQPGTLAGSGGLVVLEGLGIQRGDKATVLLGSQIIGTAEAPRNGLGSWIIPWAQRVVTEGETPITVSVRRGGTQVMETSIPLQFTGKDIPSDYDRAVHLLNRFGYGPEPELVAEILIQGPTPWLEKYLREPIDSPNQAFLEDLMALRFPGDERPDNVTARVLAELEQTSNPVRSRFVMWAENHFSTWISKTGALNKWNEHVAFTRQGAGRFKDLLLTSASSPAMLVYLDQQRSFARKLNENYAREILELHTVGVKGGYKQQDVTALARLLTGWTRSEEVSPTGRYHELISTFRYEPALNDGRVQEVLGMRFPEVSEEERYDRACTVLELLSLHPETARFISKKLVEHYVSVPAPEELVTSLARTYLESGGDMPSVLISLSQQPAFWEAYEKPRMATPLDYAVRISRMLDRGATRDTESFLKRSGMGLFDRATPDGYPESDSSYADSNAMLQRWRWSAQLRFDPLRVPWERTPPATWDQAQRQQAVDLLSMRLNGRLLGTRSNEALLKWLESKNEPQDDMTAQLGMMIARLPESHVR